MKKITIFILIILSIFFLTLSTNNTEEIHTNSTKSSNDAYIDTPINTANRNIETQNIANTIQNPSGYLGSRIEARGSSKNAVKQSNARIEAQDKALDALTK